MRISDWSSDVCSSDLTVDWACRAALERLGVATSGEFAAFWDLVTPDESKAWCLARKGGALEEVRVEGAPDDKGDWKPRAAFVFADDDHCTGLPEQSKRMPVLSPLTQLLRDRQRSPRLVGTPSVNRFFE